MAGQRVSAYRIRRRVARRARWMAARILWVAMAVVVVGGAALLDTWATRSPRFAVSVVEFTGQSRLWRDEIEAASGITRGVNLFTLDTRDVVARLEALPL